MQDESEPYANKWIEGARNAIRCHWCGRDAKRNRKGLCRHCSDVCKKLEKLEEQSPGQPPESEYNFDRLWLNRELAIGRAMKDDCIAWGRILAGILDGPAEPLALEHWFCSVAERIARDRRMHHNIA